MVKGELFEKLRLMRFEFLMRAGTAPNTILVPWQKRKLFVDGFTVDTGAEHDPKLVLDGLEKNLGWLRIHDMTVRLSRTVDDLTVCITDEGSHAAA